LKNKTKTYVLLVAVLGIWGMIGYKILNGLNPEIPKTSNQDLGITFEPKHNTAIDTFSISPIERDPFLGTLATNKKSHKSYKVKPLTLKAIENIPTVTYSGLVQKENTSNQIFVVNINTNQYLLKKGQTADSVKLVRGNSKEIVIHYKNKLQTIKRQ
jgi:hypothetical protein